jgi:hypothetical protein
MTWRLSDQGAAAGAGQSSTNGVLVVSLLLHCYGLAAAQDGERRAEALEIHGLRK